MKIGKRKYTLTLIFIISFTIMYESTILLAPERLSDAMPVLGAFCGAVAVCIGAISVENMSKYGFGKKNREEVEPDYDEVP